MICVKNLNGVEFILNSELIEKIEFIPETKVTLTTGRYYLVQEDKEEIIKDIINYKREILKGLSLE